jgi:hypothetical protein
MSRNSEFFWGRNSPDLAVEKSGEIKKAHKRVGGALLHRQDSALSLICLRPLPDGHARHDGGGGM